MRPTRRLVRRLLLASGIVVGAALVVAVATPTGRYLLRAAWEEGRILARRRDIEAIVADSTTDARTRARLQLVLDARRFAVDSLALRAGRSFTRYTDIGRDTLVLVLSAAYRDRLEAYTWWFPVVGRVPYKGYFDFGAAARAREGLRSRGYDVYLRPSSAFSTLGWFDDPLLNTTLQDDAIGLANTVTHELTHNTFYAPGQAVFNESFASFVGARASARFFRARGDTARAAEADRRWRQQVRLAAFWTALGTSLDAAYARFPTDSAARVRARDAVYADARRELVERIAPDVGANASWAGRVQLDNAALLARITYGRDLPLFDRVWELENHDLRRTIDRVVGLARSRPDDPFAAVRAWATARSEPAPGGA